MSLLFDETWLRLKYIFEQSNSFATFAKVLKENVNAIALFLHDFTFISVSNSIGTAYFWSVRFVTLYRTVMLFIKLQNEKKKSVLNAMRVSGDMGRHVLRTFFLSCYFTKSSQHTGTRSKMFKTNTISKTPRWASRIERREIISGLI